MPAAFFAKFIPSIAGTDNAARIGWQLPAEGANFPPLRWEYLKPNRITIIHKLIRRG